MRRNKDESGDFTDEAIEAVERELAELAEKIQVDETELGERIADATFRRSFDFIEEELIIMRSVAIDVLTERTGNRLNRVGWDQVAERILIGASLACGIAGLWVLITQFFSSALHAAVSILVFMILFLMLSLSTINLQTVSSRLLREVEIDLKLANEINESAKALMTDRRGRWVSDHPEHVAQRIAEELTARFHSKKPGYLNKRAHFKVGKSRSGIEGSVGIYFVDEHG